MIGWLRNAWRNPPPAPPDPTVQIEVGEHLLPVHLRRVRHARRMTLRLAADGSAVRISLPPWVPAHEALAFARSRRDWLAAQMARLPAQQPLGPDSVIGWRGRDVRVEWRANAPRRVRREADTIIVGGPQAGLAARVQRWLEGEARDALADDLAHYCARIGRAVPALALSRARRRWGSCATDGTIRINWRLIMAPDAVRRSVVAHEVAHLVHFDHSPAFHACLGDLFEGDVAAANAWLRRHGPALYLPFG
jgi:predicted metal-dependent hydrolase